MAHKTLATRQKLVFRLDPVQSKPRNRGVIGAQRSGARNHQKLVSFIRLAQKRLLKKTPVENEPD